MGRGTRSDTLPLMYERIGKYHIIRAAGRGGFGTVYEGWDTELDRNVAIKLCRSDDAGQVERFRREARIVSQLKHRNIALVYDFGFDKDAEVHFLIEEFLSGVDLEKKIQEQDRLPPPLRIRYLMSIAQGLAFVHDHGLIHRDLSPKNVRVLHDHSIKIMDFGLAKDIADSTLTLVGDNFGTMGYTAPEQIEGMSTVDHRTDIFSFGVMAYELLTFTNPFHAESMEGYIHKTHHCAPAPITELWPACPEMLAEAVHKCIKKSPADRFRSCAEIIPVLRKSLNQLRSQNLRDLNDTWPLAVRRPAPPEPEPAAASQVTSGPLPEPPEPEPEPAASQVTARPPPVPAAGGSTSPALIAGPTRGRRRRLPAYLLGTIGVMVILLLVFWTGRRRPAGEPSEEPRASASTVPSGADPTRPVPDRPPTVTFALRATNAGAADKARIELQAELPKDLTGLSHCYIVREPAWSYGARIRNECRGTGLHFRDYTEVESGVRYRYRVLLADAAGKTLAESATAVVAGPGE